MQEVVILLWVGREALEGWKGPNIGQGKWKVEMAPHLLPALGMPRWAPELVGDQFSMPLGGAGWH